MLKGIYAYCRIAVWSMALMLVGLGISVRAETVALPLTIDHGLLRALVVHKAYRDPGSSAVLLDSDDGCRHIKVSEPRFGGGRGLLTFETKVDLFMGTAFADNCVAPVAWQGYIVLYQRPRISSRWVLSFDTVDSSILDVNHRPARLPGLIWEYAKEWVYAYLEQIAIDLAPPVKELQGFLGPLFQAQDKAVTDKMLESLRPGNIATTSGGVLLEILADVQQVYRPHKNAEPEILTPAEKDQLVENWEMWDAFLGHLIVQLADKSLRKDEREILLTAFLDARHQFNEKLAAGQLQQGFVRAQFVATWERIAPVFRQHLGQDAAYSTLLGYLAFFTATDALSALDRLGPTLGIEISRNGLVRLVRLLGGTPENALNYDDQVNTRLRETLGIGPPLEEAPIEAPPPPADGSPAGDTNASEPTGFLYRPGHLLANIMAGWLLPGDAWAAPAVTLAQIRGWLVFASNQTNHLKRVRKLLAQVLRDSQRQEPLPKPYDTLFESIVLATGWQESCFRQFIIKNNKIVFLRSYNGTSVGLMQINERVWRGLPVPTSCGGTSNIIPRRAVKF